MDLREYERAKFDLAELLRAVAALDSQPSGDARACLDDLFVRLAEDRFNLVVVGRFSRGKTSLMNALLGTDRLPVGILPLTSVITTVIYGSKETGVIHYQGRRLPSPIPLDALPEYVTQQHNPGNVKQVRAAEIRLPIELLRRGFCFIDTPGLGSPIAENTRTTEQFLPEADAFILVTSFESTLSIEELQVLRTASSSARRVFAVVNKQDIVTRKERDEALAYLREQLQARASGETPPIYPVSARDGLAAKQSGDSHRLAASGIPALEADLGRFLLEDKRREFLLRFCDRVANALTTLPDDPRKAGLIERLRALSTRFAAGSARVAQASLQQDDVPSSVRELRPCEVCACIATASFDFLRRFQYELSVDPHVQQQLADCGGLCGLHTWQYATLTSAQGICTGYPALLERWAQWLGESAAVARDDRPAKLEATLPTQKTCVVCAVQTKAESEALVCIASSLRNDREATSSLRSAICLPHLRMLVALLDDPELVRSVLARASLILDRLAEDMRRYATKHDAIRRILASEEETLASERAIEVLVGLRNVNMVVSS